MHTHQTRLCYETKLTPKLQKLLFLNFHNDHATSSKCKFQNSVVTDKSQRLV